MTGDSPPIAPAPDPLAVPFADPPRRRSRAPVALAAIAFLAGIVAMVAALPLVERWRTPKPAQAVTAAPGAGAAPPAINPAVPITLEGLAAREAALDAQLDALQARIAATDGASRNAAGYAMRAEQLLIVSAVRRELNRGLPLGYLEAQLRSHFSATAPAAVDTVIAASRATATLEDLRQALDTLAPTLQSGSLRDGFGPALRRAASSLFVLRRESSPSPGPADRMARTRRMLDAGNVEGALAEVARMPGATDAASWTAAARRYVEARQALSRLEMIAIHTPLPPRVADAAPAAADPAADASRLPGT